MYIRNGQPFDIGQLHIIGENQYPVGWFYDESNRTIFNVHEVETPIEPGHTDTQKATLTGFTLIGQTWTPQWTITNKTQTELDADVVTLAAAKVAKNLEINNWREQANFTTFPYGGKLIACDSLSRSDIDAVAGHIALFNALPAGFPGGWKATDNSTVFPMGIPEFKSMYAAMTTQGTANFGHSQTLKATLAAATTLAQVNAIIW